MALQDSLLPLHHPTDKELLPTPAKDLTSTDIQKIQASLDQSVSDNSRATYPSAWRSF